MKPVNQSIDAHASSTSQEFTLVLPDQGNCAPPVIFRTFRISGNTADARRTGYKEAAGLQVHMYPVRRLPIGF
jgi:hypothetical protein